MGKRRRFSPPNTPYLPPSRPLQKSSADAYNLFMELLAERPRTAAAPVAIPGAITENLAGSNFKALQSAFNALVHSCAESISRSVEHYQAEDVWSIGTMSGCIALADTLEVRARGFLSHSQLSPEQVNEVFRMVRSVTDLRCVARSALHASRLSWLLRSEATGQAALDIARTVGDASVRVGFSTAAALERGSAYAAQNAALSYREVETLLNDAMNLVAVNAPLPTSSSDSAAELSPVVRRLTRAAVWNMAVAGESMARVAARFATR